MNRGNRRIIVASIILTLPLAILLGSFSTGAPPYKAAHRTSAKASQSGEGNAGKTGLRLPAIFRKPATKSTQSTANQPTGHHNHGHHAPVTRQSVRQVAGTSNDTGLTGGILHAFSGGNAQASTNVRTAAPTRTTANAHRSHGSAVVPAAGVLDGLVEAIKPANKSTNTAARNHRQQIAPNWDGIPFHKPSRDTASLQRGPIRDPSQAPAAQVATLPRPAATPQTSVSVSTGRSIAGSQSIMTRSTTKPALQAMPASSRISGSGAVVSRPQSLKDAKPIIVDRRETNVLSSTSSSRRSGRRVIDALDPSEIAAASTTPDAVAADTKLDEDLVPKAPRRMIVDAAASAKKVAAVETAKKAAADLAASKAEAAKSALQDAAQDLAAIKSSVADKVQAKVSPSAEIPMSLSPAPAKAKSVAVTAQPTPAASALAASAAKLSAATDGSAQTLAAPGIAKLKKPAPMKLDVTTSAAPLPAEKKTEATTQLMAPAVSPTPAIAKSKPVLNVKAPSSVTAHRGETHFSGPPANAFDQQTSMANSTPKLTAIGSGVIAPIENGSPSSSPYASPDQVSAPRIAQAPATSQTYDRTYSRDPYMGNQYLDPQPAVSQFDGNQSAGAQLGGDQFVGQQFGQQYSNGPYMPQTQGVTRPMRTQEAAPAIQVESNFQPRERRTIANEMRPSQPAQAAAVPAPTKRVVDTGNSVVASELPGIRVVTHGPKQIMIRQSHQFEIRVENRGSIDAEGVMVRAMIPDWAEVLGQSASRGGIAPDKNAGKERLVWTIDELPAGASEKMLVRLKAERSGTHGLDVDWTLMPQKSVTQIEVREPRLELTIEGPEEVVFGQSQTYRVRVLNPGDGMAPNVVFTLSPNSPTPQTQRIGNIPPGKEAQFEVELTAQDLGDLKIAGLASGDLELRAEASKTIRVSAARLEAMLTGPELKYQDTEGSYNLEIQNKGVATSEDIVATLRLPAGVKYVGGLDKAVQRGSQLQWQVSSLPPSAVRNYQFQCKMNATGEQAFAFECKGSAAGAAKVSLVTRVESIADLVMTINDPAAPAPVGADVTYEITIRNRGSKAATDVRAIAQFSHGIEPRRVEGHSGEMLTGQVLFDPIARIGAGEEVRLKVVANAARPGHHRFRSEIRSGDTILVSEEATHYMNPKSDRVSRRSGDTQTR
ncbi:DUF11 domain-containing protein [Planctomycetes bacterium K23_9]